jgi:hypothetical protein
MCLSYLVIFPCGFRTAQKKAFGRQGMPLSQSTGESAIGSFVPLRSLTDQVPGDWPWPNIPGTAWKIFTDEYAVSGQQLRHFGGKFVQMF